MMWQRRFVAWILGHRLVVLGAVGFLSAVAFWFALSVHFDSSIEIWFLEDAPDLVSYREFLDRFQGDEVTAVGIFADDVFDPKVLAVIDRITAGAEEAPFAKRVRSLTNVDVFSSEEGGIDIAPLMEELPQTAEQAAKVRKRALANPLLRGNLVSDDGKVATVIVELDHEGATVDGKIAQTTVIRRLCEKEAQSGLKILLTGTPVFDDAFFRYSERDSKLFGPIMVLAVLLTSFIVFRRWSAVMIPFSVVVLASLWNFGVMGFFDLRVNVLTGALIPLLLAVGIADSIHVLADYYQELARGVPRECAVEISVAQLLLPCFFTSSTTAAGMLSLLVSNLKPVREFGYLAAFGVTVAFALSVTLVPVLLDMMKAPDQEYLERQKEGHLRRLFQWLGRPTKRRAWAVIVVTALLVVGSFLVLPWLEVGANPMNYFKKNDPVRVHTEEFDKAFGGSASIEVLFKTPNQQFKEPDFLTRLDRLERELEAEYHESIPRVLSAVDSLKEMNRVFHDGDEKFYRVPKTRPLAAQFYLLLEGEDDFDEMIQDDYKIGRMTVRVNMSASERVSKDFPLIEKKLEETFPEKDIEVSVTGFIKLMNEMEKYLLQSQQRSFLIAFLVVTAMMAMLLTSVRLGLFSLIPNLIPILLGLAFMAVLGIPLDPGTVMIGSIALGLVVDDTVHFLTRLKRNIRAGGTLEDAMEQSMHQTGRPIVITSVVLAIGFSILLLASFTPNIYFGLVSAIIVLLAVVADLVILPAALVIIRPSFRFVRPRHDAE